MKSTPFINLIEKYDAFFIDIWGVIYDGENVYNGAVDALNYIISTNKKVIFLSNSPRPSSLSYKKFEEWNVHINKAMIYTSGDLVREQLTNWDDEVFLHLGKKFYHLGAETNQDILIGINTELVDKVTDADFLLLTAFIDEGENLAKFDYLLQEAINKNLPVICANPDQIVVHGNTNRNCAGTFAKRYENMGGKVHYYGKPNQKIYHKSFSLVGDVDKSKILMIGDTHYTDIEGANKFGIDAALVLTGNGKASYEFFQNSSYQPKWLLPGIFLDNITEL
jgi:HAD superfamily hydrolase (TIGR01459 family)